MTTEPAEPNAAAPTAKVDGKDHQVRAATIQGRYAVLAAVLAALIGLAGVWLGRATAPTPAVAAPATELPKIAINGASWDPDQKNKHGHYIVDGQVEHLGADQLIWTFVQFDGGPVFPQLGPCELTGPTSFKCETGYANNGNDQASPTISAVVLSRKDAAYVALNRANGPGNYQAVTDIPKVTGVIEAGKESTLDSERLPPRPTP